MEKILGIDVGGTKIASVLVDPGQNYKILNEVRVKTEAYKGRQVVLKNIFNSVDVILSDSNLSSNDLAGIGIAMPGPVDSDNGISIECPNLKDWTDVKIRSLIEERYNIPVCVENDARAAAAGEAFFGAGRNLKDFLYISLSTGIGCGVIINGKLYKGADGAAGELSHILFSDKKSLYSIASGKALEDIFSIQAERLKELYENGDPTAKKAFEHILHYLGIGIGNAVTLFNPEAVVVGGGLSKLGTFLLEPLENEVRANAFSVSGRNVKFLKAQNPDSAGALGAAYAVLQECY